jgi:hypothetical protein
VDRVGNRNRVTRVFIIGKAPAPRAARAKGRVAQGRS